VMKKKTTLQTQRIRTTTPDKRPPHYVDIDYLIRQEAIALLNRVRNGLDSKIEPRN
jgi:hypothetical protein